MTEAYDPVDEIESIAIIGLSGRFPGADSVDELWQNLRNGVESVTFFSVEELIQSGRDPAWVHRPNYVRARPMLRDIDTFDAAFFDIPHREAEIMDPQKRLFLECCWEAMEDAGYDSETYPGWVGVFGGVGANDYYVSNLLSNADLLYVVGGMMPVTLANDHDYLTTRVSYKLNLRGPSFDVQCACSTSLVAVHLGCLSLLNYHCDMALAGGVTITIPQENGYLYSEGGLESPDGRCRPFDAQAQGTIFGNGVGVVTLKRTSEALRDGDHIYAIIKGTAVTNDGAAKVGFTAPGVDGQKRVLSMAQQVAEVHPESINYIETHGTGTSLGDPIEIEALTQVFRTRTDKKQFCAIGSVKGNLGHLDRAAGVTGLIKTAMALKHKMLPPSINFETPNPRIDFTNSPFYVNTELREWKMNDGQPRCAAVSAFGVGGTNAHAILEEAPEIESSGASRRYQQLVLSARTETALEKMTDNLVGHLQAHPELNLADVAYTLHVGRKAFEHRRVAICETAADAVVALQERDPARVLTGMNVKPDTPVVFMFSGQGSQHVNMGRDLYQSEALFREQVDACAELLAPHLELDLRDVLYPDQADAERAAELLTQTWLTQPALFVIEYALAQLWLSWGVSPAALIGHSIGEYVAACLSGVFGLEDGLALVAARGRLMQSMPPGSMLSVPLPEVDVQPLLDEALTIATINAPERCVVSGPAEAIDALEERLSARDVAARRLHTSHAFHSPMMDPILEPFKERVRQVQLHEPKIPYVSNVTGTWITAEEATDPAYWAQHLRHTVRFSEGVGVLAQIPEQVLLEVGPGRTLRTLAQRHPDRAPEQAVLASMRHPRDEGDDDAFLLRTLGQLWMAGVSVDWPAFYQHERRLRLALPTYPFDRQRYWIEVRRGGPGADTSGSLFKSPDISEWFYIPSWKHTLPPVQEALKTARHWVVFGDGNSLSARLVEQLQARGHSVTTVLAGEQFAADDGTFTLHPARRDDYDALLEALAAHDASPTRFVNLWNLPPLDESVPEFIEKALDRSFYGLLFLAQAIGARDIEDELELAVVSSHMQRVISGEIVHPEKAALLGPCRVVSQELSNVTVRSIDVVLPEAGREEQLVDQLVAELETSTLDVIIAYRGDDRLVRTYEPVALAELEEGTDAGLRQEGVYLITGGLGGIGLTLGQHLAQVVNAKLVLTSRSRFPAPEAREQWLATHDPQDRTSLRIRTVQALEALGAEVLVVQADVADQAQMEAAVRVACERFGTIHGVIHAAGLAGGGMIPLKTKEAADRVLRPKVYGTRTLENALRGIPLDFVVLCSSATAPLGGIGQIDYCAANAFLDAFAHARHGRNGTLTVSINWDAWAQVGMAVNTAPTYSALQDQQTVQITPVDHPLLDNSYQETEGQAVYQMALSPDKDWVLSEHVLMGIPTVPGTTHLELARAAYNDYTKKDALEFYDVIFMTPLMVGQGDSKEVQLLLQEERDGFEFLVRSQGGVAPNGEVRWQAHVSGHLGPVGSAALKQHDLEAIRARCSSVMEITDEMWEQFIEATKEWFIYGPRWRSPKCAYIGEGEVLVALELSDEFRSDLHDFKLHPALLDVATSFAMTVLPGVTQRYLPLSYEGVRVWEGLPGKIYSYLRLKPDSVIDGETMSFHVTLLDENGRGMVDAETFTLAQVREAAASRLRGDEEQAPAESAPAPAAAADQGQRDFTDAILPEEGVEAFRRILGRGRLPQVAVVTKHLPTLIRRVDEMTAEDLLDEVGGAEPRLTKHPRPNLQNPYVAPESELEVRIADIWQELLGVEQVGIHDNFFDLGGDSLLVVQALTKAKSLGLQISPTQMFQNPTVAGLAGAVADAAPVAKAEQEPELGTVPFTPSQHWFFEHTLPVPDHWNTAQLYEVQPDLLDPELLQGAVHSLIKHHDTLHLRFTREDGGWQQVIAAPDDEVPFSQVDLSALPQTRQNSAIEMAVAELQTGLNLSAGPLLRVASFNLGAQQSGRLLIIIHHLACDGFSWQILSEDLWTAYQQLSRGEKVQLPPNTISYKRWAERLIEYARSADMQREKDYWLVEPGAWASQLPVDYPVDKSANTEGSSRFLFEMTLNVQETQVLLQKVLKAYDVQGIDVFLMAMVQAFAQWTGERRLLVDLWHHGRETIFQDVDLSRTVGWFATSFPIFLNLEDAQHPLDALEMVKEQHERIPGTGINYGLLRYLSEDAAIAERRRELPQAEVSLNYLGWSDENLDAPIRPLRKPLEPYIAPQNIRRHLLEFWVSVNEGELGVGVKYSENLYQRSTIEHLAQGFLEALRSLVYHFQSSEAAQ